MTVLKTVTVPLTAIPGAEPIRDKDGNALEALIFRPATLGDALDSQELETEGAREAALYAAMCGVPLPEFRRIFQGDFQEVRRLAGPLTGSEDANLLDAVLRSVGYGMTTTDETVSTSSPVGSPAT